MHALFDLRTKTPSKQSCLNEAAETNASLKGEAHGFIASEGRFVSPDFAWQVFAHRPQAPNFRLYWAAENLLMNLLIL